MPRLITSVKEPVGHVLPSDLPWKVMKISEEDHAADNGLSRLHILILRVESDIRLIL